MTTAPTPEEGLERARRTQEAQIETVRDLAQMRKDLADERERADRERAELEACLKERVGGLEAAGVKTYRAGTSAGWTPDELHRTGFTEPKKRRVRRRATKRSAAQTSTRAGDAEVEQNMALAHPPRRLMMGALMHQAGSIG